ncbi:hypothetical protein HPB49_017804 [Dermacentor silvarum]|uniref:Uncharacterized protein n=1 Tax=Dermacentor silvarum TaxID=543639 RepID=A0ACB8CAJ8_DERSI|nr:hypothetical protein HPB49_017804 [Dermacentor silvarum]
MSRRQSYTADFKRQVVLLAENSHNCAAQRELDVNEKLIRGWREQRDQLFVCNGRRRAIRGQATGRHDALEEELRLRMEEERAKGLPVSCEDIPTKARQLVQRDGIGRLTFRASRGWVQKFMRHNGLSLPTRTTFLRFLTRMALWQLATNPAPGPGYHIIVASSPTDRSKFQIGPTIRTKSIGTAETATIAMVTRSGKRTVSSAALAMTGLRAMKGQMLSLEIGLPSENAARDTQIGYFDVSTRHA